MAIVKRQADVQLTQLTTGAPVEYDTFAEVATELSNIVSKLNLITVTNNIDLDNLNNLIEAFNAGTAEDFETALVTESSESSLTEDFETALVTEASELPVGTFSLTNIGDINDFEMSLIN